MSVDRLIKFELSKLNVHIPKQRLSLKDALRSAEPHVIAGDGSVHVFKREELEFLAKMLPETDWEKLRLPIFISFDLKLGKGAAKIIGNIEVKVVSQILRKEGTGDELLIYRPEVAILRKNLPTTTQYFFMAG